MASIDTSQISDRFTYMNDWILDRKCPDNGGFTVYMESFCSVLKHAIIKLNKCQLEIDILKESEPFKFI